MIVHLRLTVGSVVACAVAAASIASAAPARADASHAPLISVNEKLQSIAHAPPVHSAPAGATVTVPVLSIVKQSAPVRTIHLPPAVARLARIERLLDIHTKTMSANLWGALDGGKGCTIRFTFRI
jgi:hypothetical protein